MIMGQVGDTAFLPGQKKATSPGHMGDMAFLPGQKTCITTFKCMINSLLYGNFHILHINPRHPYLLEGLWLDMGVLS